MARGAEGDVFLKMHSEMPERLKFQLSSHQQLHRSRSLDINASPKSRRLINDLCYMYCGTVRCTLRTNVRQAVRYHNLPRYVGYNLESRTCK